jgi:acetyl esterase/lipase
MAGKMPLDFVYQSLSQEALNMAYNSDTAVPDRSVTMKPLLERSTKFRAKHPQYLDLPYGPGERNKIDFFSAEKPNAPTLVFFHGGNWQAAYKERFAALAEGPMEYGINVAFVGYTLAPEASMTVIVKEARASIAFLSNKLRELNPDSGKIIVSGWSAGAQLAALCLDMPDVDGGLAVSGLFDLEPIRLCYLNKKLNLTTDEVSQYSPIRNIPKQSPPLAIVVGADETSELVRQSRNYAKNRQEAGLPGPFIELEECNHFTILNEFQREGALTQMVVELAKVSPFTDRDGSAEHGSRF